MRRKILLTDKIRMPVWWFHLVPPILSAVYIIIYIENIPIIVFSKNIILFILSIIGAAGFGYWLNDCTDFQEDMNVGKTNFTARLTLEKKSAVLLLLLFIGWMPWFFLPGNLIVLSAFVLLHIFFILYSVSPFRLKNKAFWGVFCDVHYGHVLPIIIAVGTFAPFYLSFQSVNWGIILSLTILLYLKGFRNIIEHQISDRKHDKKNTTHTFVMSIGALLAARLLSYVLVPLELLLIGVFFLQWSFSISGSYLLYLIFYFFLLQRWGVFRLPWRHRWFKFWYIANDFYESWLPLSILLLATLEHIAYLFILILHILLFNKNFKLFDWIVIEIKAMLLTKKTRTQVLI